MTRAEWNAWLIRQYLLTRELPCWPVFRDQFDDEDQDYFGMLDIERERGRIKCG